MRVDEETQTRILCTLYRICRSPHCRVSQEAVARRLPSYLRGLAKEALEELRRQGPSLQGWGQGQNLRPHQGRPREGPGGLLGVAGFYPTYRNQELAHPPLV